MSGFDKNTPSLFPKEPRDPSHFPDLHVEHEGPGCLVQFIGGLGIAALFVSGDIGFGARLATAAIFIFIAAVIHSFILSSAEMYNIPEIQLRLRF